MTNNIKMYVSVIKKTAANVKKISNELDSIQGAIDRLERMTASKIETLTKRREFLKESIAQFEEPIRKLTDGYTTSDLIDFDKDSRNRTIFKLKYPETIIPVLAEAESSEEVDNPLKGEVNDDEEMNEDLNQFNDSEADKEFDPSEFDDEESEDEEDFDPDEFDDEESEDDEDFDLDEINDEYNQDNEDSYYEDNVSVEHEDEEWKDWFVERVRY